MLHQYKITLAFDLHNEPWGIIRKFYNHMTGSSTMASYKDCMDTICHLIVVCGYPLLLPMFIYYFGIANG